MEDKDKNALLDTSAAAVGAAVGSGIGAAIAGPAGAVGGATLGALVQSAVQWIGREIKERQLSKREEKKIGTVYELAKAKIEDNYNKRIGILKERKFLKKEPIRKKYEESLEFLYMPLYQRLLLLHFFQ